MEDNSLKWELKERDGSFIELVHPLQCEDPTSERWYHGDLSGKRAEILLKSKAEEHQFLVRTSKSNPGDYVISVLTSVEPPVVTHIMVRNKGSEGGFDVGGGEHGFCVRECEPALRCRHRIGHAHARD